MNKAFTLIEILVVITIIALLASMLAAGIGSVIKRSEREDTKAFLSRIGQGLDLFKTQTGHYPLPTGDSDTPLPATRFTPPDPMSTDWFPIDQATSWYPRADDQSWDKQRLWWRLSTVYNDERKAAARLAARTAWHAADPIAADSYLQRLYSNPSAASPPYISESKAKALKLHLLVSNAEADRYKPVGSVNLSSAWSAGGSMPEFSVSGGNATLKMIGQVKVDLLRQRGQRIRRLTERAWTTLDTLGLADISARHRDDDGRILDRWGQPIAYIHRHVPQEMGQVFEHFRDDGWTGGEYGTQSLDTSQAAITRIPLSDRNQDGLIDVADLAIEPDGAERCDANGDGDINEEDWGSWLWNALPGYEQGYLLISGGPDEVMQRLANKAENDDNLDYRGGSL